MITRQSFPKWFNGPHQSKELGLRQIISKGFSANFVLLNWSILGSIIAYAFLANFKVMLLKPVLEAPIDTVQEIVDKGLTPIVVDGGQYWIEFLENSPNPLYQQLAEYTINPKNKEERLKLMEEKIISDGTHVYLAESLDSEDKKLGEFYKGKETLGGNVPWTVWIVNKKWPLSDHLARHILRYQQVGRHRRYN